MQEHNKASAWFEDFYKTNKDMHENIPWASRSVNPLLQTYLDDSSEHKGKALVIGSGLGDDAYALDCAGYDVVAIDISQTALDEAKKRFPDSNIKFIKQDIFDMPQKYSEYFNFVFESLTVQSLPRELRKRIIQAVVNTVAKGSQLLVVASKYIGNNDGPPWPLTDEELSLFKTYGLKELQSSVVGASAKNSHLKFRVLYQKPL